MAGSNYEAQRLEIIARNRARLQQLGLTDAADKLASTTAKPKKAAKPKAPRKPKPPAVPTRHSRRQGGEAPAELDEGQRQLAAMYVDGVCPKCGKAFEKGIKQHFDKCTGVPSRPRRNPDAGLKDIIRVDDEEEAADDDEQQLTKLPQVDAAKLQGKLKELELSGLIDFSSDKAEFVVLGSTGSKYVVTLADTRHTCKCMDFRIRQRPCKHIRLVLQQLGIAGSPANWHQAVDRQLDAAAQGGNGGGGDAGGAAALADVPETDAAAAGAGTEAEADVDARSPAKARAPEKTAGRASQAQGAGRKRGGPDARGSARSQQAKRRKAEPEADSSKSEQAGSRDASTTRPGTRRLPKSLQ